jgi:probable rRNA maturation factor
MIIDYSDEAGLAGLEVREQFNRAASAVAAQELLGGADPEEAEHLPVYISVTFVNGDDIRRINSEFRGIDRVTDVLSFPQYGSAEEVMDAVAAAGGNFNVPVGDVVICLEKALAQSKEYGTTPEREVTYLFVHSLLHLLGYDHMEEDEKRVMREHEERVMDSIGLGMEK